MKPTRRNSSDSHLRELERRVLAGDLTAVSALARAYERVARGEPPFDVTEQTRRLVADVERVEETGEHGSIRDVLTELVHLARERGGNIEEMLEAAIQVADEEEAGQPCPDCGGARTPEGRGMVPTFWDDDTPGRRRRVASSDNCEHDCHDSQDDDQDEEHDPECTQCEHDCPRRRAHLGAPYCAICDDHNEARDTRTGPYVIGSLVIPGTTCNERWSTRGMGSIVIGGDRGDVHATEATNTMDGVEMHGVELHSMLNGLTDEEAREIAEDVVRASWESVGEDTFRITRSRQ